MREWRAKAIEEIDAIFDWLLKADKWSKLANRLTTLMLSQWTATQQEAIYNAVSYLYKTPDAILNTEDVKLLITSLERDLGKPLAEAMREPLAGAQGKAYAEAHKDVGLQFETNKPDREALDWLQKDSTYWIGSYYDRELARSVQDAATKAVKDGLGWAQAGDYFKQVLGDRFERTNGYWEGLANHVVTRSREFGHVSAYDKAGVEYLKVEAVVDRRTSSICRHMNGRVIAVSRARQLRDNLMNAKTPDDVKNVSPWLTDAQIERSVSNTASKELQGGLSLPPYHFFCRSRTVMAYEEEIPRSIEGVAVPGGNAEAAKAFSDMLKARVINKEQFTPKEVSKIIEFSKNAGWGEQTIRSSGLQSLEYHFWKHGDEPIIDVRSMHEYSSKAVELIRDPNRRLIMSTNSKNVLEFHFWKDDQYALVLPEQEELSTFYELTKEKFERKTIGNISRTSLEVNAKGVTKWILNARKLFSR